MTCTHNHPVRYVSTPGCQQGGIGPSVRGRGGRGLSSLIRLPANVMVTETPTHVNDDDDNPSNEEKSYGPASSEEPAPFIFFSMDPTGEASE
jgi:hypothetical protein